MFNMANLVEEVERALLDGKISLRHLELAHIGYMRHRKDLPEGVKNQFVGASISPLLRFSSNIGNAIGVAHLSYLRGKEDKSK